MITNRQKEILKFIVEEYVKTVKPVSSSIICKHLNCSSATIRNDMVLLEEAAEVQQTAEPKQNTKNEETEIKDQGE